MGTGEWAGNILYNIKASGAWDKRLLYFQFLPALPGVAATYLGILLPARLVEGLENHWEMERLAAWIFVLSLGIFFLQAADAGMREYLYRNYPALTMYYEKRCYGKAMRLDYGMLEDPQISGLWKNTWNVLGNEFGFRSSLCAVPAILSSLAGIVWYGIMIAEKSRMILLLTLANALVGALSVAWLRKKHTKLHEKVGTYARKTAYISRKSMDRQAGKDIRMYQMADWFLRKYDGALEEMNGIYRRIHNRNFVRAALEALTTLLVNAFSYFYLISLLAGGALPAAEFVLYMGLTGSLSRCFGQFLSELVELNPVCVSVGYIRRFLALPESPFWSDEGVGRKRLDAMKKQGVRVEIKDLCYSYPESTQAVFSHLNLTVGPGEKLALIGLNGAGKTTLVKLLCGFYRPDEGEILINGIPSSDFRREEYQELVCALFQDSGLLPMTLDFNLTGKEPRKICRERLSRALRLSGFLEKYESLPQKGESLLVREVNGRGLTGDEEKSGQEAENGADREEPCGVDFSGGEKQKLLFARALYKEAPLMILDVKYSIVLIVYGVYRVKEKRKIGTTYTNRKKNVYDVIWKRIRKILKAGRDSGSFFML